MFVPVDEEDINGLRAEKKPTFVNVDEIISYTINGIPTKDGKDFEKLSIDVYMTNEDHYRITKDDNVTVFIEKVMNTNEFNR